ncbi:hypothetical protein WA556_003114, partial [Blastocystis sp. ATCC 50177/Nand II]
MATEFVDKGTTEAIKIFGDIKTRGEQMYKEIDATEAKSMEGSEPVLPWDLPEFVASPMYQSMLQSDILQLSKDPETFLKAIEGCEDERYSPNSNAKMIVLLRKADKQLQTIRFQLVQQEGKIDDDHFWRNYLFRVFQLVDNYKRTMEEEKKETPKPVAPVEKKSSEVEEKSTEEKPAEKEEQPAEEKKEPEEKKQPTLISTIPDEVNTVDDIYDFSDISDIEKEVGDVDIGNVSDDDLSDIEARILSE